MSSGPRSREPDLGRRDRPDMHPQRTGGPPAAIVARARFIDDLVAEQIGAGIDQIVLLGAGLDTLAQRHPEHGERGQFFESDQPGTQAWKRRRLVEIGHAPPDWLHFVPVDFESGERCWRDGLRSAPASIPGGRRS